MQEQKHSGLGIASFIISIVSGTCIFLIIVIGAVMEASIPGGIDEESAGAVMLGLFLFAFLSGDLLALGLGIGGLLQKDRNKIFAILGTVLSVVSLVGTIFLMILGFAFG